MIEKTEKKQSYPCKVAVVGCGPAGMLAALKLAPLFEKVALIGPQSNDHDMRTTALMTPAIRILQNLGLWPALQYHAAPLSTMRIVDSTDRLIRSPTVDFCSSEIGEDAFGYNIPNIALNAALSRAIEECPAIHRLTAVVTAYSHNGQSVGLTLADNSKISTRMLVAADGRASAARDAAGIGARRWTYPQAAMVLSFSHQRSHQNISTEFHTAEGPFTQVPLPGNRSSLVWVVHAERAQQLSGLDHAALNREIENRMHSMLGSVNVETPVQSWPMSAIVPKIFAASRTVLIGEAAHVFPPIGAQGLNLGIRDIMDLSAAVAGHTADPGDETVMRSYNRQRKPDIWIRTGFVHALNRTLLSNFLPVQIMRCAGLEILRQFSPLRSLFMHEGMYPGHSFQRFSSHFPASIK